MRARSLWACVPLLVSGCSDSAPQPRAFDVLVISLDTVRADALTFRDSDVAPNLARLARSGTIFTQAVSGSSWTLPAHAQLFTGQPPSLHRVETDDVSIDTNTPTLPEVLSQAGWATHGFWTGWYLADAYGFARGFDAYTNAMSDGPLLTQRFEQGRNESTDAGWAAHAEREKKNHEDITSEHVAQLVGETLEAADAAQSLFVFAHFFDPHYDYIPPGEWATKFDPDYTGTIDGRNFGHNPRIVDPRTGQRTVSDRDLQHITALYRGEIGWTDQWVGRVLEQFEQAGRLDDTLIIVTSDHGEEFFEHGNRGHKLTLFEEVVRVPLLVVLPEALRGKQPASFDVQVSLSDVLPTILDVTGVEAPPSVFGRSLLPALEGRGLPARPEVSSLTLYNYPPGGGLQVYLYDAVRTDAAKLIRLTLLEPGKPPQLPWVGLIDLRLDPHEKNLVGGPPADFARRPEFAAAWDQLEAELERMRAVHGRTAHQAASERTTDMAALVAVELEGLGYMQGEAGDEVEPGKIAPWGLGVRPAASMR